MLYSVALLYGLAIFLFVLFVWSFRQFKIAELKKRVERQLIRKAQKDFDLLEELGLSGLVSKAGKLLDRAGIDYDAGNTLLILALISSALVGGGLWMNMGIVSLVSPIVFILAMYSLVIKLGEKRIIKLEHEFRYALYDMASALRVNNNLINAINEAAEKCREPLKSELREIVAEVTGGEKEEKAMYKFIKRTRSTIIESWVDTINFAKETGKELAVTCERAAIKIREKNTIKNKIYSQTAGVKGTMAGILAILGLFVIAMISTGNFGSSYFSKTGKFVLAYVIISYLLSTLWVFRTIEREVNS